MEKNHALSAEAKIMYTVRAEVLESMGYTSYSDYLASDLWHSIREQVIQPGTECAFCHDMATQVHHESYDEDTMRGLRLDYLYPVCHDCHQGGEFGKKGIKLGPREATHRMIGCALKKLEPRYKNRRARVAPKIHPMEWKLMGAETKRKISRERWKANRGNITQSARNYMAEHGSSVPADVLRKREFEKILQSM